MPPATLHAAAEKPLFGEPRARVRVALSKFPAPPRLCCQGLTTPKSRTEVPAEMRMNMQLVLNEGGGQFKSAHCLRDPPQAKIVLKAQWLTALAQADPDRPADRSN